MNLATFLLVWFGITIRINKTFDAVHAFKSNGYCVYGMLHYMYSKNNSCNVKKQAHIFMHFLNFCFDFFTFSLGRSPQKISQHLVIKMTWLRTYRRHSRLVVWYVLMWWRDGLLHSSLLLLYLYALFISYSCKVHIDITATTSFLSLLPALWAQNTHTLKPMCWWWWCWCYVGYRCCEM